jgi:hypothetical protein
VILLRSGAREVGRIEIDGRATVVFPFTTAGGREVLTLSTPQAPTVSRQPNGDTRPLLVGIRSLRVGLASDGADSPKPVRSGATDPVSGA